MKIKLTPIRQKNTREKYENPDRMHGYLKVNSILKVNSTYVNYTDSSESGLTVFMVMKRYQRLGKLVAIAVLLLALSTLLDIQERFLIKYLMWSVIWTQYELYHMGYRYGITYST